MRRKQAIQTLRGKGHAISDEECEAAQIAILLHDVGHGPFSHVLESCFLQDVPHEEVSLLLMHDLNRQFGGRLSTAIRMFEGTYERPFFHQLVSSQLDMDRMDYLNRDGYYTGVAEGAIGAERIIKMLDLVDDQIMLLHPENEGQSNPDVKESSFFTEDQFKYLIIFGSVALLILLVMFQAACMIWKDKKKSKNLNKVSTFTAHDAREEQRLHSFHCVCT